MYYTMPTSNLLKPLKWRQHNYIMRPSMTKLACVHYVAVLQLSLNVKYVD